MNRSRTIGLILSPLIAAGIFGMSNSATAADARATATASVASSCNDGKRLVTVTGNLAENNFAVGSYDVYIQENNEFISEMDQIEPGTTNFSLEANLLPGSHELFVWFNYPDADRFTVQVSPFPVVVGECTSTPVTPAPSVSASSDSECTLTVLYTGVRPELTLSVSGKKTLSVTNVSNQEAGRVEYVIDASGGSTKGKKANVYSVLVTADNGLKDRASVFCP